MYPYINDIALVFVCNTAESFFEYMNRIEEEAERTRFIESMKVLGDRALLHPKKDKLAILSAPVFHLDLLRDCFGYSDTQWTVPKQTSPFLSTDIINDESVLNQIVEWAAKSHNTLHLIPHATTPQFLQLAKLLGDRYGLNVILPESPKLEAVWVRDYIDTKSGFRALVAQWFDDANRVLIDGFPCNSIDRAAEVVRWFLSRNQACLVKADRGHYALGHTIFRPQTQPSHPQILQQLQQNTFLKGDVILVEAFIPSSQKQFPSVEFFVPSPDMGEPFFTYACNQLFLESGSFAGVLVSRDLQVESWYDSLVDMGLTIGQNLQLMGYVGHFDLDCIVDDSGQVFLSEVNARRTGGTHIHEVGQALLGHDYVNQISLITNTAAPCGMLDNFADLEQAIAPVLYPIQGRSEGVVVTHSSSIADHKFGYIILAASTAEAIALQDQMNARIQSASVFK